MFRYLFLLFFLFSVAGYSQTSYFYENEFSLYVPAKNQWSFTFGLGNRGMLGEKSEVGETGGYQHEHIEVNQFTNYKASENSTFSLGLRYRFRETFEASNHDEFRLIEQWEYETVGNFLNNSHRLRVEQRFRENTIHRLRYEFGIDKPLNEAFTVGAATEAIYSIASGSKPEAEQRFSISFENTTFKNMEIGLGLEYRLENYNIESQHEFFIISEISWEL